MRKTKLQLWIEEQLEKSGEGLSQSQHISWALYTHCFSPKSIVRIANAGFGRDLAYLKISVGDPKTTWNSEIEVRNREKIRQRLAADKIEALRVPRAYGT